jgi:hypothetical protein
LGCAEETTVPKLVCTQPDFVVNKSVEAIQVNAGAIVTKYTYNDIIEAYVVSSDENGNFSNRFLSNFGDSHQAYNRF